MAIRTVRNRSMAIPGIQTRSSRPPAVRAGEEILQRPLLHFGLRELPGAGLARGNVRALPRRFVFPIRRRPERVGGPGRPLAPTRGLQRRVDASANEYHRRVGPPRTTEPQLAYAGVRGDAAAIEHIGAV